jgi:hypothetical protein
MTPSEAVTHTFDAHDNLRKWVEEVSVEDLAAVIASTTRGPMPDPTTNEARDFTPWQRLCVAHHVVAPFDRTSTVQLSVGDVREASGSTRSRAIFAQKSTLAGTCPDVSIMDPPTGSWKTGMSLVAAFLLAGPGFERLCQEHRDRSKGSIFNGVPNAKLARLVLVGTTATTFDHFVSTLELLLPRFREDLTSTGEADLPIRIWTTTGKAHSTRVAMDLPGVTFWVMPVDKLKQVTRQHPEVSVAVCIADEGVEREHGKFARSPIFKWMLLQATPQALVEVTQGNKSWLKDFFGGVLESPRHIMQYVRRHNFTDAQTAAEQLCQLDLVTMAAYRKLIRADLRPLVPSGLAVHTVLCRRVTLASQVMRSAVDMAPRSLPLVLEHFLLPCGLCDEQKAMLRSTCEQPDLTPGRLMDFLRGLTVQRCPDSLARLQERLAEFSEQCPICFSEGGSMRVYGCCGYCVCDACYASCNLRCAFCRTPVPRAPQSLDEAVAPQSAPSLPPTSRTDTLAQQLAGHTTASATQDANLVAVLQCLVMHGHTRVLVVVESSRFVLSSNRVDSRALSNASGVNMTRVDHLLSGKGTQFAVVKRQFDTADPRPRGLICYGDFRGMLVGTDLTYVDAIVAVGIIPQNVLTQALGRVFRPRRSRDNSRPITMVNVRMANS